MSRYTKWKERQKTASPYANEAVCRKCEYFEMVRSNAYCNGFVKPRKIPKCVNVDKMGYCTQYCPKNKQKTIGEKL